MLEAEDGRVSFCDADRRRMAFWSKVLGSLLVGFLLQGVYAVYWAGQAGERITSVENKIDEMTTVAASSAGNTTALRAMVSRQDKIDTRIDRLEDGFGDDLKSIEGKLDRLIERFLDTPTPQRRGQ